jgi:hypothetical protein
MYFGWDMAFFEFVLPFLVPPLLGGIIGWGISLVLRKTRIAIVGGIVGGTVGNWIGYILYRTIYLPGATDASLAVFSTYLLTGVFVGSSAFALVIVLTNKRSGLK